MQNIGLMTNEEITREVDAFYQFTQSCGMSYLNEKGLRRFNQLKGELASRMQRQQPEQQLAEWNAMSQKG